jgi:uncharacterized membrane protein (UPF0182 family)
MSDFFDDEPDDHPRQRVVVRRHRRRPIVLTVVTLVALLILFSIFTSFWTDKLWFDSLGGAYPRVFSTLVWTRIGLFVVFGALMALIVGVNLALAFRLRPLFRPNSPEQAGLDRYREVITPIRRVLLVSTSAVVGIFAGASGAGEWRNYLMWRHAQPFGRTDPYFHKDIGFYVFDLPWLHYLVDFGMTAVVLGLVGAAVVHYLFGGIRLQAPGQKLTGAAQVQVSVLLGLFVLFKGADYYLDRFDLTSQTGSLITGMTYTRDHAVLPSKNILMAIAVICALLFFANVFRRTWLLPGVGLALFVLSAVLLGMIWPAIVQRFQVRPDEPDKEAPFIANNILATRRAFDLTGAKVTEYDARTKVSPTQLKADAASLPGIRLVDPLVESETFQQLQQVRGYYSVPGVLDVDRYRIEGRERDLVVAPREIALEGLPDASKNWANEHTVYTHGYGMIAAYGNQRNAADVPQLNDGKPVWAERDIPPVGQLGKYRPQIYFGENSPAYSIVGKAKGGPNVELDVPQGNGQPGESQTNTYHGRTGVPIGGFWHKLLYATKFGDTNILLSSRIHPDSKILYDRSPRQRVQDVAPWLTVDSDALPSVVNGRIVWILDGYTTTDRYPLSQKESLSQMTSDALNPRTAYATLPNDQINYMRNSVKAVVDAYSGTVTLYAWDTSDPILKAWEQTFPGVVKPRRDIPHALLEHMRYPEDMFKVQREMLARYHVLDPKTFYEQSDQWTVPQDPTVPSRTQPPYRLTVSPTPGSRPVFSLTSVYVPFKRENLASFISVGADATDPKTYGKIQILRLPGNTQVSGPSQIANTFNNDPKVADQLLAFKRSGASVKYGNLLTLPVGGGLLYVEPLYTQREGGAGNYPVLRFVLVSFGNDVGIGQTLNAALDDLPGLQGSHQQSGNGTGNGQQGGGTQSGGNGSSKLTGSALKLLQQADQKFAAADRALRSGNLQAYARLVNEAHTLVQKALTEGQKAGRSTSSGRTQKPGNG